MIERLGIADEINKKSKLVAGVSNAQFVVNGKSDLAVRTNNGVRGLVLRSMNLPFATPRVTPIFKECQNHMRAKGWNPEASKSANRVVKCKNSVAPAWANSWYGCDVRRRRLGHASSQLRHFWLIVIHSDPCRGGRLASIRL